MKSSQKVVVSAFGILTAILVVMAALGRVALSQSNSETMGAGSTVTMSDQITETFDLSDFQGVEIEGAWQVRLTQGDEWQVEISRSGDFADEVRVHVRGNRLILERESGGIWRWWNKSSERLSAEIVMPELNQLETAGANGVDFSGFNGDRLDIEVAGASNVVGRDGQYEDLDLSVAGANEINLKGLVVTSADVDLAGAPDVELTMNGGALLGSMAGAGSLEYYGTISEEGVRIAGVGRVRHMD